MVDAEGSADPSEGPSPDRPSSKPIWLVAIVAAGAWLALRIWVVATAEAPRGPDNVGPWATAFVLARLRPRIDMVGLPPYSVGTGAVLAPVLLLVDDPLLRYRLGIVLLSCLAGVGAYAVSRTVRWTLPCGTQGLVGAILVAALGTSVAFTTSFTWVEPAAFAFFGLWLALLSWTFARPSWQRVTLVGAYSGSAVLIHGRFTLLAPTWLFMMAWWEFSARRTPGHSPKSTAARLGGLTISIAASMVFARWLRSWVVNQAWSRPSFESDLTFIHEVDEIDYWIAVVQTAVGQAWYGATSTFGLALVGAWSLVLVARRSGDDDRWARVMTARTILVGSGAVYATSVLWIAPALLDPAPPPWGHGRWDHLVHGRYIDAVVITLASFGAAALVSRQAASRRVLAISVVAVLFLSGAVVFAQAWADRDLLRLNPGAISGVSGLPLGSGARLARWSACGVVIGTILLIVSRRGRSTTVGALALLMIVCAASGSRLAVEHLQKWDSSPLYAAVPDAAASGRAVVASDALTSTAFRFNYPLQQFELAPSNWSFEISPLDSVDLAGALPPDAGLAVLWWNAAPAGSWCEVGKYGKVRVWVSSALVPERTDGCTS